MRAIHPGQRVIERAIDRGGFLRGSGIRLGDAPGHKEWLHFCFASDEFDLLLNFSVVDAAHASVTDPAELARVVCLIRDRDGWDGDVVSYRRDETEIRRGYLSLQFGQSRVHFHSGVFHVQAVLPDRDIEVELLLTPLTIPTPANNITLDEGPPMHWLAVPRLLASGYVRKGDHTRRVRNVLAYHDHNWGSFRWGRNFAWQWGYALPDDSSDPLSFVMLRLGDRARIRTFLQSLFVWRGPRQYRAFRDDELTIELDGALRQDRVFKLPRVMSLLASGNATDVPERLLVTARGRDDSVQLRFDFRDVAQIIIPNDDDLDVTIINESRAHYTCEGNIRGERFVSTGRALVEFLGH